MFERNAGQKGRHLLACLCFSFVVGISFGQTRDQLVLPRINGPVKLDGLSDEPAWKGIEPLPFIQFNPNFGSEPSERTEILVAHDNNFLYIAGRLYDKEPAKIQANSKQRDSGDGSSDWWGVAIDSFNDNENALAFFTTPAGLRWDAAVFGDAQGRLPLNTTWNTFWDVAVARNGEGWFAEMRIPFTSLRFQDRDGRVMIGLISWRSIARKNECVIFPRIPPKWGYWSRFKPSQAQKVVLKGVRSRKPLYITPYMLGGIGQSFELNSTGTAYQRKDSFEREIGLDVKYGLTSNLTLDVTLNTDFAQVEADDQQVNLTRFSLFFPEKRLFFQERSSIFDFDFEVVDQNRLFYTRRIGIYNGRLVPIYAGARLIGRLGPWDLGFLSMQTAPVEDLPSENSSVFRLRRQIFNAYSYVGGIIASKIGMNGAYNTAYGLDGIIRLCGDDYLTVKWAQTFEKGRENKQISLDPARIFMNWQRRSIKGFGYGWTYSRSGPAYNPGLGYQKRTDYSFFNSSVRYGWIPGEKSFLFLHTLSINEYFYLRNSDKTIEYAEIGPLWEFFTKSGGYGKIGPRLLYEDVPKNFLLSDRAEVLKGKYRFFGLTGEYTTPSGKLISALVTLDAGSFYDGRRISLGLTPTWHVSPDLELSAGCQFNRVVFPARNQRFVAHIARLRALYMLSTKFSAVAFIQYNSAIDAVMANVRLRYNPREGIDLYLVYNEGLNTDRFRLDPALPFSSARTVMLKYSYTFNL